MSNNLDDESEYTEFEDSKIPEILYDEDDNFDEVLQLTEYVDTGEARPSNTYIQAEYNNINVVEVNNNHQKIAKSIVQKITKFILNFNDVQLTEEHKSYLKSVANLQLNQLSDLLSLTAINKQLLDNMVLRINSVQAEDYAMVATYTTLANQHLKFHKELQNTYKNIPTILRKMRLDVMESEQLLEGGSDDGVIVEDSGITQFNNTKEMLKLMREKQANKIKDENNLRNNETN